MRYVYRSSCELSYVGTSSMFPFCWKKVKTLPPIEIMRQEYRLKGDKSTKTPGKEREDASKSVIFVNRSGLTTGRSEGVYPLY